MLRRKSGVGFWVHGFWDRFRIGEWPRGIFICFLNRRSVMASFDEHQYFHTRIDFLNVDHFKNDCKINLFLGSHEAVYVQYRENFDHHYLYVIHRKPFDSVVLSGYFDDDAVIGRIFTTHLQLFADQLSPS